MCHFLSWGKWEEKHLLGEDPGFVFKHVVIVVFVAHSHGYTQNVFRMYSEYGAQERDKAIYINHMAFSIHA